jgi:hypothetical protein
MNHHTVIYYAYKAERRCVHQVPSLLALVFKSFILSFIAYCTAPTPSAMTSKTNQTLHVFGEDVAAKAKATSGVESDVPVASSSSNVTIEKMANKDTPMMSDYWKKFTVTEVDRSAYHTTSWLGGVLESFVPEVDVPAVDNSIVVCFESHFVAGLGLPPSKFLVSIMNFLRCELVHLNLNAIATLNCFTML